MAAISELPNFVGDVTLSRAKLNLVWTTLVEQLGGTATPRAWTTGRTYYPGDLVTPTVPNGHHYRRLFLGAAPAQEPTWSTVSNALVLEDGYYMWEEAGGAEGVYAGGLNGANLVSYPGWTRAQVVESQSVICVPFFSPDQGAAAEQVVPLVVPAGFQAFATTYTNNTGNVVTGGAVRLRTNGVASGHFRLPGYRVPTSRLRRRDTTETNKPGPIYNAKVQTINGYAEEHGYDPPVEGDDVLELDFADVESGGAPTNLSFHLWGRVRHL